MTILIVKVLELLKLKPLRNFKELTVDLVVVVFKEPSSNFLIIYSNSYVRLVVITWSTIMDPCQYTKRSKNNK